MPQPAPYQGDSTAFIIQPNIEGFTSFKATIVGQLANTYNSVAVMLQGTHCEEPGRMKLRGYTLAAHVPSRIHGLAIFCRSGVRYENPVVSPADHRLEWAHVTINGCTLVNIYHSPNQKLNVKELPLFTAPTIYTDDFNCHHTDWGYSKTTLTELHSRNGHHLTI